VQLETGTVPNVVEKAPTIDWSDVWREKENKMLYLPLHPNRTEE